jgi:hypothetical protein
MQVQSAIPVTKLPLDRGVRRHVDGSFSVLPKHAEMFSYCKAVF